MAVEKRKISQLPTLEDFTGQEYMHIGFNGKSYKLNINSLIAKLNSGIDPEVLQDVAQRLQELDNTNGFVTPNELATAISEAISAIEFPVTDLSGYSDTETMQQYVLDQISSIVFPEVDLSPYATTEAVEQAVAAIDIPDVSNFVTKEYVDEAVASVPSVDLTPYSTTEEVSALIEQSTASFVTEEAVDDKIAAVTGVDLSAYATVEFVNETVSSIDVPSVDGLASEEYVDQKVSEVQVPSLEGYATTEYVDEAIAGIPGTNLEGLATEEYVDQKVSEVVVPSIDGLATEEYVDQKVSEVQVPSVEGLATEEYVNQKVAEVDVPSIDGLATVEYVDQKVAEIDVPSLEGLATEDFVANAVAGIDLSGFATTSSVEDLAEQVDNKISAADTKSGRILFVDGAVRDNADGSIAAPFATLQQAIDAAPSSSIIQLLGPKPGSTGYVGETVINNKENLIIQGYGCAGSHSTVIFGQVKITGSSTRIRFKNLAIRGKDNKEALLVDGSQGRLYFDNVDFSPEAGSAGPIVRITNGAANWYAFNECSADGDIEVQDTNANVAIYFNRHNAFGTKLYINSQCRVTVVQATQFGYIEQNEGTLDVRHCCGFAGKDGVAIKAAESVSRSYVSFTDFERDGSYLTTEGPITLKMCNTGN